MLDVHLPRPWELTSKSLEAHDVERDPIRFVLDTISAMRVLVSTMSKPKHAPTGGCHRHKCYGSITMSTQTFCYVTDIHMVESCDFIFHVRIGSRDLRCALQPCMLLNVVSMIDLASDGSTGRLAL